MAKRGQAKLKPLTEHCYVLSEALAEIGEYDMLQTIEWLQVASSVKSVGLDMVRYDKGFGWCSGADQYTMAKEKILKAFVTNLSIFTFTWGALESAIDELDMPPHPKKSKQGKINTACYYISDYFESRSPIAPYGEMVFLFRKHLAESTACKRIADKLIVSNRIGLAAFGLYAVYKVRNMFAHGGMSFPEPEPEEHRPISHDPPLIETATRILLLSMQMLFVAHYARKNYTLGRVIFGGEKEIPLIEWLRVLHYRGKESEDSLVF